MARPPRPNRGTSRRPANRDRTRTGPQPRATGHTQQRTTRPTTYLPGTWGRPQSRPGYGSSAGTPAAGAAGAAVASAPAAAAAQPYSLQNLPVDASYDQTIASLQKQRVDQLAGIAGERVRTLSDYGFHEGPNGFLTFDPNNPFSKASVLKQTHETMRKATGQNMAAGGQLYAGAYQNAQDQGFRNQLAAEDQQQKMLAAFLARNTGQQTAANTGYETAAGQALGDRTARFQSNPNYDPATGQLKPDTPPPGAAPATAAPKAASSPALEVWQKGTYNGKPAKYVKGKWYYTNSKGTLSLVPGQI